MKTKTATQLRTEDSAEMQKILQLMCEFDERTGRHARYNDPAEHWARKSIAVSKPEDVTFTVEDMGGFVYKIEAQSTGTDGETVVKTEWVHEDGIRGERDSCEADHPVHRIVCVTDLVERAQGATVLK